MHLYYYKSVSRSGRSAENIVQYRVYVRMCITSPIVSLRVSHCLSSVDVFVPHLSRQIIQFSQQPIPQELLRVYVVLTHTHAHEQEEDERKIVFHARIKAETKTT